MRILKLQLKNFLPILTGMGKKEITLDLINSNKLLNVIVGKIGSGKTYVLSHLQPFATLGTLDVRNGDDPIVVGEDGLKSIWYQSDDDTYEITHEYLWSGNTHNKKSYIKKNGLELNPNGNMNSFKEIILNEFGIEQSILYLLRLGPNVTNFIKMKTTERKAYIANLLSSTEIYLKLYKHWSQELRNINATAKILMNRLGSYGDKTVEEYQYEIDTLQEEYDNLNESLTEVVNKRASLQAVISTLLDGLTLSEYEIKYNKLFKRIEENESALEHMMEKVQEYNSYPDEREISENIIRDETRLSTVSERLSSLDAKYSELYLLLNNLQDKKNMSADKEHIEELRRNYNDLKIVESKLASEVKGFRCKYTTAFLTSFLEDLHGISIAIAELMSYDIDLVKKLLSSDESCIKYAKDKIDMLTKVKYKTQVEINNIEYSKSYTCTEVLYFPPMCPVTKSCPYAKSHPSTIKGDSDGSELNYEIESLKNKIVSIDIDMERYGMYGIVYAKISSLKSFWNKVSTVLNDISALRVMNLNEIILTGRYQEWYSHNKIIDTIDMIGKVDAYYEIVEKLKVIKSEISSLDIDDSSSLDKEIQNVSTSMEEVLNEVKKLEDDKKILKESIGKLNAMYINASRKADLAKEITDINSCLEAMNKEEYDMKTNLYSVKDANFEIDKCNAQIDSFRNEMESLSNKISEYKAKVSDIKFTHEELDKVIKEQEYMSYMVDAVGSKEGIPMVLVKLFLDNCRYTMNDMINSVCEDELEILPFEISENSFEIPYMINGNKIDDISKASQGQTSIASTAISFALSKESSNIKYNIPLLDEMDGPLHKSDKHRYISMMFKYLRDIDSEQCFVISHDEDLLNGQDVQFILTTEELVDTTKYPDAIRL